MSSNLKQPSNLTFFIDRSLGKKAIASALIDAGHKVIIHDDVFAQNTPDEKWLKEAGRNGWIILSKDNRIRYRANEISALESANALAFILIAANVTGEEMATIFMKASKRMIALAGVTKRPAIFTIGRDAKPKKI